MLQRRVFLDGATIKKILVQKLYLKIKIMIFNFCTGNYNLIEVFKKNNFSAHSIKITTSEN